MNKIFHTLSYFLMWLIVVPIVIVPAIIFALLPAKLRYRNRLQYWVEYGIYWLLLKATLVPVEWQGLENVPQDRPVIFAANHQSALDILLLGSVSRGRPQLWMTWSGNTRFPVFGWILSRLAVVVHQDSPRQAVQAIATTAQMIREYNTSLMIFPEGGRFIDGTIHKFFRGFAMIAEETHYPVVPVALFNPGKVNPPHSLWIHYAPMKVVVGPVFTMQERESALEFAERVQAWFKRQEPLC
jgi:1-acyl-sn-glycerol-3-phosphate acyltransferase